MKKMFKAILLLIVAVMMVLPQTVFAASSPYATYTYSSLGEVLYSPDAYVPDTVADSAFMGLKEALKDPRDIFVGPDSKIYIADAGNNRVVVLDRYMKFLFEIKNFVNSQGVPDTFNGCAGVFVNDNNIFVCDTENNRIVMFDTDGNYLRTIPKPESNLFEEGSIYKPVACVCDQYGRLFVISSTTYQGVIVINTKGDFFGFIGATKVPISALELLWRKIQTKEQIEMSGQNVSTEYNNITIDNKNFIYVTTSALDEKAQQDAINSGDTSTNVAPVKKLNASGEDVMKRNGFFPPSGEVSVSDEDLSDEDITGASRIVDVAMGPEGTWSIVDQKRSKVFTYNENGDLLFVFGDKNGVQNGNIDTIAAIAYQGSKILILDKAKQNIVTFRRTEYADLLLTAIRHDNEMQYSETINDWTEILKRNNNFDSAYVQIGKSLYRQGKYSESMDYFRSAFEISNYSESYQEIRKEWANKFFWIIPIVIVVACILIVKFFGYAGKVNKRTALKLGRKSLKEELLYAFHVIVHPFDGFWDLKHEQRGSARSAFVILILAVATYFYNSIGMGYIFQPRVNTTMNLFGAITAVCVPVLLWVIANWCLTTLFEGEGSMKDIFVATCYCLTPIVLLYIPATIISNFLTLDEAGIISLLTSFAFIWLGLLLFIGMMVTHDYSIFKNILTCVVTIGGMAFIMFIGILFSSLMGKIVSFVTNIIAEISFRL